MEIPAAIVGKLAEYVVIPIGRQVGYLAHYKSNHENLQKRLVDLTAAMEEVQHKVDQVSRRGERIKTIVMNWKTRVDAIITKAGEFLNDGRHGRTGCLHGLCPNLVLRYQLSKKSTKLVKEIDELYGKKEFSNFAYHALPLEVCLLSTGHYNTFESRNSIVTSVIDELSNSNTEIILVWGIGGVGKTTLVEQVLRQVKDVNLFDDMVMVRDVKESPDLEKIQKEIAMKLGMSINENHTLAERAPLLCDRIKDKRTLVVFDDVWEKVDLVAIGLPRLVTCKLVITCRSRKELSVDMRTQKDISLDVLNEEEAWILFEKMAGDVVKDSRIRSVAIQVAKKCGGLPVLIITVARALKCRNKVNAWKDTLRRLGRFDKEEFTEKAYLALEWSYDQLEVEELKQLFLLCGIIVVKNHIYLTDLLNYGFGLGLIRNVDTIEEAHDALDTLVEKLKDSCLLLDSDIKMHVRMHDLVYEVATRIASREHVLSVGYGGELKEWPDKEFLKGCGKMSLKSSKIPMLSQVYGECLKLEMFHLYRKGEGVEYLEIPSDLFSEMEKLKVLALSKVRMLSLPSSLQFLKKVQTLCLEECKLEEVALVGHLTTLQILSFARSDIEQLPKEIGQLIRLRLLDLSDCARLKVISPGVISSLERLEDLRMRNVFFKWEAEREGSNASLLELKDLSRLMALEICIGDANILPSNLFCSKLVRYQIYIGYESCNRENSMAETTLNKLKLKLAPNNELNQHIKLLLKRSEDLSLAGIGSVQLYVEDNFEELVHLRLHRSNVDFSYIINMKIVFPNLTTLAVSRCDHMRFLFTFSMAKSLVKLKYLKVSKCERMEEIVSTTDQSIGENIDIIFCKLECLTLKELPGLARFCTSSKIHDHESGSSLQTCLFDAPVKFPSLERLTIEKLEKLQTLWNYKLADQESFCRLKHIVVVSCKSLRNMFVPRMMGRLTHLETVKIRYCDSLQMIFNDGRTDVEESTAETSSSSLHHLRPFYCQSLSSVFIGQCRSLKTIFSASVARGLQKLYSLEVDGCDEVEEIIAGEQGLETDQPPLFLFPKVTRMVLWNSPKLRRLFRGMHAFKCPLLTHLRVKMIAAEVPIFSEKHEVDPLTEQSLFLVHKDSFPNLERLSLLEGVTEIWYGASSPAQVFSKLKSIKLGWCEPFSKQSTLDFLQKLPRLATLEVTGNFPTEILFVNGEMNGGAIGTLSGVKVLKLYFMSKLLQLGNGVPVLPNLDTLEVCHCEKLKSVEPSAISFRNLTTLKVNWCDGMEYLTTYSVAKSLMQLTTLEVIGCCMLREIIGASNKDDHDTVEDTCHEIAFSRLQYLTLFNLPSLQGFCSENCIVKLPSSTKLDVRSCPIELKVSSEGVFLSNPNPTRLR